VRDALRWAGIELRRFAVGAGIELRGMRWAGIELRGMRWAGIELRGMRCLNGVDWVAPLCGWG
jgi:hypothetical protein